MIVVKLSKRRNDEGSEEDLRVGASLSRVKGL